MRERMEAFILQLQEEIITALENVDPNAPKFMRDRYERENNTGYGISGVFGVPVGEDGLAPAMDTVLEKGGVNISVVNGHLSQAAIQQMRAEHSSLPPPPEGGLPFFAAGLSLVIHPRNPHAPTCHANWRYFEVMEPGESESPKTLAWWFGGGSDLTPFYLYEEDAVHFHKTMKDASDPFGTQVYPAFKKWCDEYFYITHRKETRGIGGLFWDDFTDAPHKSLSEDEKRPRGIEEIFAYVQALGKTFVPAYVPILAKRCKQPSTPHERRWQLIRRGRYAEFNLMIDRGTKFGLMAPHARIESILMSLPETARWEYMSDMGTDPESPEGKLMAVVKVPREWV